MADNLAKRTRLVVANGWLFRAYASFESHIELVREVFRPAERHRERVAAVVCDGRRLGDLLVGIHLRGTNYRDLLGGRHFFDAARYRQLAEQVAELHPGRRVSFLLCSDEPIDLDAFAGLDVVTGTGDAVEDLYALAGCDLICGPPSTFNMWASFYGRVPRYQLESPSDRPRAESFAVAGG